MLSIGPPGSCCYINSIVQLPLFYDVGTVLYGSMFSTTTEVYEPMCLEIHQGRDIEIKPGLTKYKIELFCNGNIEEVVGIATSPFNPCNINSDEVGRIPFFPIYIHCGRECYLFMESINQLFQSTGMVVSNVGSNQVVSAMEIMKRIDDHICPVGDDEFYDLRYTRIGMNHRLLEFLMTFLSTASGATWNGPSTDCTLRSEYGVLDDVIPLSIQFMGNVRYVAQLRPFLNPYGNVPSDIAVMTIANISNNFDRIKAELVQRNALIDRVGDIYMTEAEDYSFTGKWLTLIQRHETSDFQFPIRKDDRDISDIYARDCNIRNNFRHSFTRMTSWNDLSACLQHSLCFHDAFEKGDVTVQRSWLEDIVIRDADGNIVKYADMVLLTLMCAEGLINTSIVDQIAPLFH